MNNSINIKEKVVHVCKSNRNTYILTQSGNVYSMGCNSNGKLGLEIDDKNISFPSLIDPKHFNHEKIVQMCTGFIHLIALSQDGNVYSWGNGTSGRLGHGDQSNKNVPHKIDSICFNNDPVKLIQTVSNFSFALTKDNKLYSWGENDYGQLALGHKENQFKPTLVDPSTYNNERILKISCGHNNVFLLTQDNNSGKKTNLYACGSSPFILFDKKCTTLFQRMDSYHFGNQRIKDVKCEQLFLMVSMEDDVSKGTKICVWFRGQQSEISSNEIETLFFKDKNVDIESSSHHLFAIVTKDESDEKTVFSWMIIPKETNKIGLIETNMGCFGLEKIVSIDLNSVLFGHSYAITQSGKLFTWEHNEYGQLGLGHYEYVKTPQLCCPELFGIDS